MHPRILIALPLLFGACDLINQGQDLLGDLTNPLVTEALILGVSPPSQASDVDLPDEFSEGAGATIFLADAGNVADLENAPIGGAEVTVEGVAVSEIQAGAYALQPGALAYAANADWEVAVTLSGDTATATVALPPPADVDVPAQHTANAGLTLDLTGAEYDGALVVVVDQDGNLTFDNRPGDIQAVYDLARGGPVSTVEVPGTAFPGTGAYLVGVAGIRNTSGREDVDGMNTALSTFMAGQMVFEPLVIAP